MKKQGMIWLVAGLGLVIGIAIAGDEQKMSLDQVPEAARMALMKLAGNAPITEVECEKEHGMVFYEAEWAIDGREIEAKVTAGGDLVEMEEPVDAADVPEAVRAVAEKRFPGSATIKYEKVTIVLYEIEAKVGDKKKEITVLPTGQVFGKGHNGKEDKDDDDDDDDEEEEELTIEQVPAAVKATILAEAAGATVKEIEREFKNGQTVYEAEWVINGQEIEIKVAADGTLLKKQVGEDDDEDGDDK